MIINYYKWKQKWENIRWSSCSRRIMKWKGWFQSKANGFHTYIWLHIVFFFFYFLLHSIQTIVQLFVFYFFVQPSMTTSHEKNSLSLSHYQKLSFHWKWTNWIEFHFHFANCTEIYLCSHSYEQYKS